MNRVASGIARGANDFLNDQVAFSRRGEADGISLVSKTHVKRSAVCVAIDGHRAHAKLSAGSQDANGNLATIGNQDFLEHFPCAKSSGILTFWFSIVCALRSSGSGRI